MSYTDAPQPTRQSHVTQQISNLEKTISMLAEFVESFEQRLTSVLVDANARPLRDSSERKQPEQMVILAQELAKQNDRLQAILSKLANIKERVEL